MASQPSRKNSISRVGRPSRVARPITFQWRRSLRLAGFGLALTVVALGVWGYGAIRRESLSPDAIWAQAQVDLRAGQIDRVEKAVARLGRLRPPTPLDRMLRAQLAVARVRAEEALAELARVPDDHHMAAQARLLAGQIELRYYCLRAAEQSFREAIRLDPKLVQAHRELICIYSLQLRRAEVCREFLTLSGLTNLSFAELFHWGLLRSESWDPAAPAEMLVACVAADPGDCCSRLTLSENYRLMGMLANAESVLAGVPLDDPQAIAAHARIALDRNDENRAERLLESGQPDDPALAVLRGRLALSRRDASTARHHFQIAYDANTDSREGLSGLIVALVALGDTRTAAPLRAIAAKRERLNSLIHRAGASVARDAQNTLIPRAGPSVTHAAASTTPEDPALPRLLGDACTALHRDAEARGWYQLAIARDPLDSRAQQALFQLNATAQDASRSTRPGP
jgi:tetratricopeptide (TPR) repeat protein